MKRINLDTKRGKLFTALQNGEVVTPAQAAKRWDIQNLSAEATRLRHAGYAVYANTRKAKNGTVVTEYELGLPSRRIVALGYMAAAEGWTV